MTNTILLKRSSTAAKVPLVTDLQAGEPSYNTNDGLLYFKKTVGGIDSIVNIGAHTYTGDVTGAGNGAIALTLANSGVTAGTYNNVVVDAKGRVTLGSNASYLVGNQAITFTGDATGTGTTNIALTLANTGITAGTYNANATQVTPLIVDAKGRITGTTAAVTITPQWTSILGLPTTVAGFGITDSYTKAQVDAKTWDWTANITGEPTTLAGYGITDAVASNKLGANNGVATLDATGKLTTAQIPAALVGAMNYQGVWNATTNTPSLTVVAAKGMYYKVSVAGNTSLSGFTNWTVGDLAISDGTAWEQVQGGTSDVSSVFGRVGAVTLNSADVTGALGFTPYNATNPSGYISANQAVTLSGDVTGTGTTAITATLAAVGTAGTYTKVTTDSKGRVTVGATLAAADIPNLPWSKITSGLPTTLAGYGITDGMHLGDVIDGGAY
jgi:hypothetical protein